MESPKSCCRVSPTSASASRSTHTHGLLGTCCLTFIARISPRTCRVRRYYSTCSHQNLLTLHEKHNPAEIRQVAMLKYRSPASFQLHPTLPVRQGLRFAFSNQAVSCTVPWCVFATVLGFAAALRGYMSVQWRRMKGEALQTCTKWL